MDTSLGLMISRKLLEGEVMVLDLLGEIDVLTAPKIKDEVTNLVREGFGRVLISLERVGYIDSSGLGVLLGALKKIREINGHMCLVCSNPQIMKIFDITGLTNVFEICKCDEDGIESLTSQGHPEKVPTVFWYGGERYHQPTRPR